MNKFAVAGALFFFAGVWLVDAANKQFSSGDVCCKVLGRSGKITFLKYVPEKPGNQSGNASSNPQNMDPCQGKKSVTAEMDELKELDKDGNAVGTSGQIKHSFNTFASQDFTFSDVKNETFQNLSVKTVTFSATINGADFKVHIYIFSEAGNITNDDEVTPVKKGTMKFSIEINNWSFCGCKKGQTDETGTQIEFTLTMKGSKSKPEGKGSRKFEMGDGDEVILSNKIKVNGTFSAMASGYPKLVQKGSKNSFVFRFPKGATILYDPTVEMSSEPASGEETTSPPTTAAPGSAASFVASNALLMGILIMMSALFNRA